MATASNFHLTGDEKPAPGVKSLSVESAKKASELLNINHKLWDIYIDDLGRHNHITHHVFTLYAMGATPDELQAAYDAQMPGQRHAFPPCEKTIKALHTPEGFKKYLGDYTQFTNYVMFFRGEVEKKGSQKVIAEYLFADDDRANDMMARLFTGFAHSIIHFGYGLQFDQPAMIVEALAQTAVHEGWALDLFLESEKAGHARKRANEKGDSLLELIHDTRKAVIENPLIASYRYQDNTVKYGIAQMGADVMAEVGSKWIVRPEDLKSRTAQMMDACVYYNVAAQRPPYAKKVDFYLMHSTTLAVHFETFMSHPFLTEKDRIRLLEWKGRWDLANYASRGAPELLEDEVFKHEPRIPGGWDGLIHRANRYIHYQDGGHVSKMIRAIVNGWDLCKQEDRTDFALKTEDNWLKAAHLFMDFAETAAERDDEMLFMRGAGFEEGWKIHPLREGAQNGHNSKI
ncbi:hypothetical protein BS50DRAFT_520373 [Corynespora cassiicola Philippines]|uniref:HypA-like protein n=1 Tax=Corynespora cassiicola Philippines TaxID=1448308 RepID=A0A2T2NYM7_CORCC|nr:hypothetical protein BS50DRAFT_520373 [Corynespora cassiicola Philippines]